MINFFNAFDHTQNSNALITLNLDQGSLTLISVVTANCAHPPCMKTAAEQLNRQTDQTRTETRYIQFLIKNVWRWTFVLSGVPAAQGAGRGRQPVVHPPGLRRVSLPLPPKDRIGPSETG